MEKLLKEKKGADTSLGIPFQVAFLISKTFFLFSPPRSPERQGPPLQRDAVQARGGAQVPLPAGVQAAGGGALRHLLPPGQGPRRQDQHQQEGGHLLSHREL